jgi:hypothetical protein
MAHKPTAGEMSTSTPRAFAVDRKIGHILGTNTKMEKLPDGREIINSGVTMAPAKRSGIVNVCAGATAACIATCVLWFAGRRMSAKMRACAKNITTLWALWPARFYARFNRELSNQERRAAAAGVGSYCRPNVASDLNHDHVVAAHPSTTFYDYTAIFARMVDYLAGCLPKNYFLTFSVKESTPFDHVAHVLENGGNVAVVVDTYYWGPSHRYGLMPETATFTTPDGRRSITVPVIDGDRHDIRTPEYDGRGKMIGLRLKAQSNKVKARARLLGFAKPFALGGKENSARYDMRQGGHITIILPAAAPAGNPALSILQTA